ncbi:hypothetical protein GE09DRAFT_1237235 [Coniochaeta sp. 2T2.1]|nr:hypothetical protein GE09DRAFT_1237235 [Coniochaeta sp. 2T2.1]
MSYDHIGDDLDILYGLAYTACLDACAEYPNCAAVAWNPTQLNSPCFLKTTAEDWTSNPSLWGAIGITPFPGWPSDFETQITSTITALPAGASLQTLTGGFTEDTIITTTSPGGHSPTVVPVIVPRIGPPVICWGCIPFWPINIVINIPEIKFCIVILGIKIGFCGGPPSGGGGHNGKPENGSPTNKPSDRPTNSPTSSTSATSSSSAPSSSSSTTCTVSVTATYESVFCSVTLTASTALDEAQHRAHQRRQGQETGCSTLAYNTVTGCSVVPSTTTTTSTSVAAPRCSEGTCGKGTCPARPPSDRKRDANVAPQRVSQPPPGVWVGPENYEGGSFMKFMPGEVFLANIDPRTSVDIYGEGRERVDTTFNFIAFKDQTEILALTGLHGCTALVAISQKGAWMAHFWEDTAFESYQNTGGWDWFDSRVTNAIDVGLPADVPRQQYVNQYALGELRNKDDKPRELGHMFDDIFDPFIFYIFPRYDFDRPGADPNAGFATEMYPEENIRVMSKVRDMFGNRVQDRVHGIAESYSPLGGDLDEQRDTAWENPRGKLLIQYMPAHMTCPGQPTTKAKWRFIIEDGRAKEESWDPWPGQIFIPPPGQPQARDSCPLSSSSVSSNSQSTTASPTSEAPTPTSQTSSSSSSPTTSSTSSTTTVSSSTSPTSTPPPPPPSTTSSSSTPPPPPTTTTTQPEPKPTTTCTLDVWQYYALTPDSKDTLLSYIKWSLGKADTTSTWSADHVDLQWDEDVVIPVPPDARLQAPLRVREVPGFAPPTILLFWYGGTEWSTEAPWLDQTELPYVTITPGDGRCVRLLSAEYCDRRVVSNFLC